MFVLIFLKISGTAAALWTSRPWAVVSVCLCTLFETASMYSLLFYTRSLGLWNTVIPITQLSGKHVISCPQNANVYAYEPRPFISISFKDYGVFNGRYTGRLRVFIRVGWDAGIRMYDLSPSLGTSRLTKEWASYRITGNYVTPVAAVGGNEHSVFAVTIRGAK